MILDARRTIELSDTELQVLLEIEPILRHAQLHLACPRCLAAGHGTRALVGGQNGPEDVTWKVSCECTHRTYRRAQAS